MLSDLIAIAALIVSAASFLRPVLGSYSKLEVFIRDEIGTGRKIRCLVLSPQNPLVIDLTLINKSNVPFDIVSISLALEDKSVHPMLMKEEFMQTPLRLEARGCAKEKVGFELGRKMYPNNRCVLVIHTTQKIYRQKLDISFPVGKYRQVFEDALNPDEQSDDAHPKKHK